MDKVTQHTTDRTPMPRPINIYAQYYLQMSVLDRSISFNPRHNCSAVSHLLNKQCNDCFGTPLFLLITKYDSSPGSYLFHQKDHIYFSMREGVILCTAE